MSYDATSKSGNVSDSSGDGTLSSPRNGFTHATEQAAAVPSQEREQSMLASFAGSFAEDPFWEEMMEAIRQDRQKMDAKYGVRE